MEQTGMRQILELLVEMNANQARLDAKWDADKAEEKAERKAHHAEMMATIRRGHEEMIKA
jgi:hypothetical protein